MARAAEFPAAAPAVTIPAEGERPLSEIFEVAVPGSGRLAVVARPRGGIWLADDLAILRAHGVDTLVSALPPREAATAYLEDEHSAAVAAGIDFVHFPIPNLLTPPLEEAVPVFASLAGRVRRGGFVAAHCFASQGRGPLIVASTMVLLGVDPDEAWGRVAAARRIEVPDTHLQRNWVGQLVLYRSRVG